MLWKVPQTNIISFELSLALQNTAPMLIFLNLPALILNKMFSYDLSEMF